MPSSLLRQPNFKPGQLVKIQSHSWWFKTADLVSFINNSKTALPPRTCVFEEKTVGLLLRYNSDFGRCPEIQEAQYYWEVLVNGQVYDIAEKGLKLIAQ